MDPALVSPKAAGHPVAPGSMDRRSVKGAGRWVDVGKIHGKTHGKSWKNPKSWNAHWKSWKNHGNIMENLGKSVGNLGKS